MKRTILLMLLTLPIFCYAQESMIADITESVETEFGTYIPYLVEIEPDAAQYEIESDFSNVVNFTDFNFTEAQKAKLLQNHFLVIPGRDSSPSGYKEIYDIYNEAREKDIPQFITTDAVLHTYHKLYDKILMTAEEDFFIQFLIHMDNLLLEEALNYYNNSSDDFAKECFRKVVAYFSVPLKILDENFIIPDSVADIVNQELTLIDAHEGYVLSPLFNAYDEDYSQYKPRGHYTKTEELKKYFKAMMWHGRQTFTLFNAWYYSSSPHPDLTGAALALIHLIENIQTKGTIWTYWNNIYIPTVFFVGKADDLLPQDYLTFAKQYFGEDFSEQPIENNLIETTILDFITQANEYFPEPLITTNTPKGMRFMGQRFIPDSYMLDQLVFPFVPDRLMPKSLDVLTVMNSDEAYNLLSEMGETNYIGYIQQLAYLKDLYENYPDEQWTENLYWNWLYCLIPLLFEKGEGFPPFMQNLAWLRKDINTALGSWTELRHDTILYAKQSCTELVSDKLMNNNIQGYVEPNPYLFARLASLSKLMCEGLLGLSILNEEMEAKLTTLEELLLTLKSISEKELTGGNITMGEYSTICDFGKIIEDLVTFGEEAEWGNGPDPYSSEDEMPVIADVHTDSNTGTCLEEGVGYPFRIFVICQVENELKVTVGGIFSYYEFIQPLSNRLTDEEWAEMLVSEDPPQLPYWTSVFVDTIYELSNNNPDYYYLYNEGIFTFSISFSDSTPELGDEVTLYIGLSDIWFQYHDMSIIIENDGIETFELPISSTGENSHAGTFSTEGMTEGKIYITIYYYSSGLYYKTSINVVNPVNTISEKQLPSEFLLHQNFPNPFNSSTQIQYDLPINGFVKLSIYNILGGEVLIIKNEYEEAGYKTITWNGKNKNGEEVPTGVYFYSVDFGDYHVTKKMLLLK